MKQERVEVLELKMKGTDDISCCNYGLRRWPVPILAFVHAVARASWIENGLDNRYKSAGSSLKISSFVRPALLSSSSSYVLALVKASRNHVQVDDARNLRLLCCLCCSLAPSRQYGSLAFFYFAYLMGILDALSKRVDANIVDSDAKWLRVANPDPVDDQP